MTCCGALCEHRQQVGKKRHQRAQDLKKMERLELNYDKRRAEKKTLPKTGILENEVPLTPNALDRTPGRSILRTPRSRVGGALLLMLGQLGFATKLDAAGLGSLPAVLRPFDDPLALILSERTQERSMPWPMVLVRSR